LEIIKKYNLTEVQIDRIIEMAWEDRTPFEAIEFQFGLSEGEVVKLMKNQLKLSSWKLWRERAHKVSMKHTKKRDPEMLGFKCKEQRTITGNKLSKR